MIYFPYFVADLKFRWNTAEAEKWTIRRRDQTRIPVTIRVTSENNMRVSEWYREKSENETYQREEKLQQVVRHCVEGCAAGVVHNSA